MLVSFMSQPLTLSSALAMDLGEYKDVTSLDGVRAELKYATKDNFMKENVYGEWQKAYLHKDAFAKFAKANEWLRKNHTGHSFLVYDALRPRSMQWKLWNHVKDTPAQMYVANPERGSVHNYGFALDLTVADAKGRPLDMGAGFDDFREIAQPKFEQRFLEEGKLTEKQIENRKILREAMISAGFTQLPHEWWHYEALPRDEIKEKYKIVEDF